MLATDQQSHLYKISPPRADMIFRPGRFWRTPDWESSSSRPKPGYIEDIVLFAGDFDEVSLHLFPRIRTLRVRAADADAAYLRRLGMNCSPGVKAHIFAARSRKAEVDAFQPTVFKFERDGFTNVRRGEYVSRHPQIAIASETMTMNTALERWNIEACYVEHLDSVVQTLSSAGIYFDEQT